MAGGCCSGQGLLFLPVFSTVLDPSPVNLISATKPPTCFVPTVVLALDLKAGWGHSGVGVVEEEDFRAWVARLPHAGVWQECSSGSCSFGVP